MFCHKNYVKEWRLWVERKVQAVKNLVLLKKFAGSNRQINIQRIRDKMISWQCCRFVRSVVLVSLHLETWQAAGGPVVQSTYSAYQVLWNFPLLFCYQRPLEYYILLLWILKAAFSIPFGLTFVDKLKLKEEQKHWVPNLCQSRYFRLHFSSERNRMFTKKNC